MGRVPIWKQWLIIGAGVVLSPAFILLTACLFGWLTLRRLCGGQGSRPDRPEPGLGLEKPTPVG
jgi:hypothetical protein